MRAMPVARRSDTRRLPATRPRRQFAFFVIFCVAASPLLATRAHVRFMVLRAPFATRGLACARARHSAASGGEERRPSVGIAQQSRAEAMPRPRRMCPHAQQAQRGMYMLRASQAFTMPCHYANARWCAASAVYAPCPHAVEAQRCAARVVCVQGAERGRQKGHSSAKQSFSGWGK